MDDDAGHPKRSDARAAAIAVAPVGAGARLTTEIIDSAELLTPPEREWLRRWLPVALEAAGAVGDVRVRLVEDAAMDAAHRRYGGQEGTTDVLTFDMRDEDEEALSGVMDVDLWACVDEARRQGRARGTPAERELLLYCLHGVLHCLGYDDHDEEGFVRMHAEEDRILETIGVGRIFGIEPVREPGGSRA